MEMVISFPGGLRVDADFGGQIVRTDQPPQGGGDGSAPTPFVTFLASIGTCAGIYVLGFLRQRSLPTEGVRLVQRMRSNPFTGLVESIDLDIQLPEAIPEKYHAAIIRSADLCAVKKHFEYPPAIKVSASMVIPQI
ncbi:MAG: OsmC family protein [Anaerolineales bacterium]|nr:OsmC family protein [Anaerolineales bacterium]